MPSFTARLADGWKIPQAHLQLALVPLLTALLDTNKITKVLAADGMLRLGLPATAVNLWQFVSAPNEGVNIDLGGPLAFPLGLIVLPFTLAIQAGLTAGYFGSIHDVLATGSYDFGANVRRYFAPFLLYTLIPVALVLPLILVGSSGARGAFGPLVIVLIPVVIVAMYRSMRRRTSLSFARRSS